MRGERREARIEERRGEEMGAAVGEEE